MCLRGCRTCERITMATDTRDDARYVVGAAGVVTTPHGRVLLIRTARFGWELPGGRMEWGEDLIAALAREIEEESGCRAAVGRLVGVSSHTTRPGPLIFTFACRHIDGEPRPGDDSLEAGWFEPGDAVRLVTHPAERDRLRDGLAASSGVVYRAYRGQGVDIEEVARYGM